MTDLAGTSKLAGGVAVHAHYAHSKRLGMSTILTLSQVHYIVKKFVGQTNPTDSAPKTQSGHIDNLYEFLKRSNASYISLVDSVDKDACGVSNITTR